MSADPITTGLQIGDQVPCSNCEKSFLVSQVHSYKGKDGEDIYICSDCKGKIDEVLAEEIKNPNLVGALVGGALGAFIAGLIWYFFATITGYELGYIAIGVGWIIGMGVHIGSGKKRGVTLQVISVLATFVTLYSAEYLIFIHVANKIIKEKLGGGFELGGVSPFDSLFFQSAFSPIGILIWAIALYVAFRVPKARKI